MKFRAVILAGGSGERFWPLSTPEMPKQFLSIFGGKSLLRQCVERLCPALQASKRDSRHPGLQTLLSPSDIFVVTSAALVRLTRKELPELPAQNIVGEPMRRDTGAAVALGVGIAGDADDTVLGFFPADQLVTKPAAFRSALRQAIRLARQNRVAKNHCLPSLCTFTSFPIVTLGIAPTYPATGFGYIDPKRGKFVEKPDEATAKQYIRKGYLWNAGMFIARAGTFRAAFAAHAPALLPLATIFRNGSHHCSPSPLAFTLKRRYAPLPRISFDYAVMEKISSAASADATSTDSHLSIAAVPADCGWDDVGGYLAFDKYFSHDANGNVLEGVCQAVDAKDNIIVSRQNKISVLGATNLVIVSTPDGILVADKAHLGSMKKLFAK